MHQPYVPVPLSRRLLQTGAAVLLLVVAALVTSVIRGLGSSALPVEPVLATDSAPTADRRLPLLSVPESLGGRSGSLRFRTLTPAEAVHVPGFLEALGGASIRRPAAHEAIGPGGASFVYIVLRPFGEKRGETLNGYRLGRWPAERWIMARSYFNPDGFVEVTPANRTLPLSTHFTLGEFVTHDQDNAWPKYVVLEERLIDKLELVLRELETVRGQPVRATILSGFRAPYYNARGESEGMARASRHMFGDAADVIVDSDGDGRMDDLDRDGRTTLDDTRVLVRALAAVEARFPDLKGGLGTYGAMGPRGPFVHIDVRGTSARWESGWWKGRRSD